MHNKCVNPHPGLVQESTVRGCRDSHPTISSRSATAHLGRSLYWHWLSDWFNILQQMPLHPLQSYRYWRLVKERKFTSSRVWLPFGSNWGVSWTSILLAHSWRSLRSSIPWTPKHAAKLFYVTGWREMEWNLAHGASSLNSLMTVAKKFSRKKYKLHYRHHQYSNFCRPMIVNICMKLLKNDITNFCVRK